METIMKNIKGKTFEFCDVIIGQKITVAVVSSEDDEYGDEARDMIYRTIPNVQSAGSVSYTHLTLPTICSV